MINAQTLLNLKNS